MANHPDSGTRLGAQCDNVIHINIYVNDNKFGESMKPKDGRPLIRFLARIDYEYSVGGYFQTVPLFHIVVAFLTWALLYL